MDDPRPDASCRSNDTDASLRLPGRLRPEVSTLITPLQSNSDASSSPFNLDPKQPQLTLAVGHLVKTTTLDEVAVSRNVQVTQDCAITIEKHS